MNKLIGLSVLTLLFVTACERRDKADEKPLATAETPSAAAPTMPGRGEGEREMAPAELILGDPALSESYRQEIASDPDLSATAGTTSLVTEEGQLVLKGTVPTTELRDALAKMAKVLADGRDIKNEIIVLSE